MFSLFAGTSHADAIKVMCDSPLEPALTKVAGLFRHETNNQVTLACNAGPAIKKRIERRRGRRRCCCRAGFCAELTSSGKVRAGDRPMIGRVGVGLGNRTDSPAYDISTTLRNSRTLCLVPTLSFLTVLNPDRPLPRFLSGWVLPKRSSPGLCVRPPLIFSGLC